MSMYDRGTPYEQPLKSGDTVYICRCGLSKTAPFCDGSHQQQPGTEPLAYTAPADETVYICGCGRTGNKPWCDGSHAD
jgi:CDGSH-type Zn-finger protein